MQEAVLRMNSHQRVLAAVERRPVDRIPRFDPFWEFPDSWKAVVGSPEQFNDIHILYPDETPFPSSARTLRVEGDWIYEVDGWGRTVRRRHDAFFVETLQVAIPDGVDPDAIDFESPSLDSRYLPECPDPVKRDGYVSSLKSDYCVFGKTGGPYLRTCYVRGEAEFLMDIAQDPPFARALADKVADHLSAVGVELIRRFGLAETGIWIYDDMAHNLGPMFSAASFEEVFLPAYVRMIRTYKDAGAKYVFLHSDGDIRPLLDMLVDAGIDGLNPLERRANMNIVRIREMYPQLALVGGMCNSDTLVNGPIERIEAEAKEIIDLARDGGIVIGAHSLGPDVPLEHFAAYHNVCSTYGVFERAEGA